MPNTKPPVAKVFKDDPLEYWCIEGYLDLIAKSGGDALDDVIVPLYLTKDTTPEMIAKGAEAGLLRAAKYYRHMEQRARILAIRSRIILTMACLRRWKSTVLCCVFTVRRMG